MGSAEPPSAEIPALIYQETLTHSVGRPTDQWAGSCLTSPGQSTDTPCFELCLVPGPVLVLEMQGWNLVLQGWRRFSGVCVRGVSGIWMTLK